MADGKITALREKVACFGDRQAPFRSWLTDVRQTAVSPCAHFHMHKIRIIPALKYYNESQTRIRDACMCSYMAVNKWYCKCMHLFLFFKISFVFNYVHPYVLMSIWVHECRECAGRPEVLDTPGSRVAGSCELPDEGARNPTLAFWKSSQGL